MAARAIIGIRRIVAGAAALALASCAEPSPPSGPVGPVPTFVSLDPCLDAILLEVADVRQIIALSHYSRDPAASSIDVEIAYEFYSNGGTAEEIIAFEPDYVLASQFIAPATKSALESAGLRVEIFGSATNSDKSFEQIRRIAALAFRQYRGEALIEEIASGIETPESDAASALLWQPGQIVAGEASLVAEHLDWAGFTNHGVDKGLGQADYVTLEDVLADPPDLLLVAGDAPGQRHPSLDALTDTHVARFDPKLFYCAGPSILRARERLADIRSDMQEVRP